MAATCVQRYTTETDAATTTAIIRRGARDLAFYHTKNWKSQGPKNWVLFWRVRRKSGRLCVLGEIKVVYTTIVVVVAVQVVLLAAIGLLMVRDNTVARVD